MYLGQLDMKSSSILIKSLFRGLPNIIHENQSLFIILVLMEHVPNIGTFALIYPTKYIGTYCRI